MTTLSTAIKAVFKSAKQNGYNITFDEAADHAEYILFLMDQTNDPDWDEFTTLVDQSFKAGDCAGL